LIDRISVEKVTKKFGKKFVLRDVSFNVASGEVVALLGPNGAGKSSLLNCIVGGIIPNEGRILFNGILFFEVPDLPRMVGFVRGSSGLDKGISAINALHVAAVAVGVDREREILLLENCGIAHIRNQKVRSLSTGEKQRLAIAIALLPNPQILLLDEPQNGLDAEGIIWFRTLVKDFARRGGSVLIATHYLSEIELIADRVAVINKDLILVNRIDSIKKKSDNSLEEAYLRIIEENLKSSENHKW